MEVEQILSLCMSIYRMAENVKANKERCQRVAKRVKALEELVLTIKQRGLCQFSAPVNNALRELYITLSSAKAMMMKYSQAKPMMSFLKSGSHEDKFSKINERLNDNFQILNGALQIEQGDTLNKVYDTLSRRRGFEETGIGFDNPVGLSNPMSPEPVTSPGPPTSPAASTPFPRTSPSMPVTIPTAPMHVPSIMPPMPGPRPTISMPTGYINPAIPVNFSGTMAPMPLAPTVVSQPFRNSIIIPPKPVIRTVAPMAIYSTMAPVRTVTPQFTNNFPTMTISPQNQSGVTTYVVNRPF